MAEAKRPAKRVNKPGVQPLETRAGAASPPSTPAAHKHLAAPVPEKPVMLHVAPAPGHSGHNGHAEEPAAGRLTLVAPVEELPATPDQQGTFVEYIAAPDAPEAAPVASRSARAQDDADGPLAAGVAEAPAQASEPARPVPEPQDSPIARATPAPVIPPSPSAPPEAPAAAPAAPAAAPAPPTDFHEAPPTRRLKNDALTQAVSPGHASAPGIPAQPLMFEVAWEVCWQLGGIYTVIRSKAQQMVHLYGDRYYLIGPYNADTAAVEIEYAQPTGAVAVAIERLRALGIIVHYGHWLISGRPRVILLDFAAAMNRMGEFKYYLWKDHGIQAADADYEVNNVTAFGFLVGMFFQQLCGVSGVPTPILAHFHEWMAGLGAMRIKFLNLPIATVFTTHATLLGRYLCTDNPDFYSKLPYIHPDDAAGHYNIYARYCIERGSTACADVFTTVSDVTGYEAERLLCRKPDVITPNGLNIQRFAALHEFQNLHKQYKEVIHRFVSGHFFPSYHFDLDKTIYLFTAGRYEYGNKGIDLFIESLARLNHWLRMGNIPITVVAFIVTRAPYKSINVDVLKSQAMFDELQSMCDKITDEMGRSLVHCVSQGRLPERGDLMTEEGIVRLKRGMHAWRTWKQPHIVTHDLWDDANDPVLKQLRACQLFNARHDAVKVVFHPDFLSATSPLIGLDYDQFVRGCHMGVFPSYYEPWGYTPAECIASGVPSVTSDLAGFGSYVLKNIQDPQSKGLFVVGRRYASFDQAAHQLTEILFNFALKERRARIELRNSTERLSEYFDWSNLIAHYTEAHKLALQRKLGVAALG
jgi:glycogen(starch) synthase